MALTCRDIAAAVAGTKASSSAAASSCWREVTLPLLRPSAGGLPSLLTWAAHRSGDVQQLWLSDPILIFQVRYRMQVPAPVLRLLALWLEGGMASVVLLLPSSIRH